MKRSVLKSCVSVLLLMGACGLGSSVEAVTLDFDSLSDLDAVTTQFSGLTFSNTAVLTAGISLNEFEFPPRSGANVVIDDSGAITIVFDAPQVSVGGFFTYLVPLVFTAFDAADLVVGAETSDFGSNLALSGDPGSSPNEFLGVVFAGGIKRITIEGDPAGESFTLDDFTFTARITSVPGPATVILMGLGLTSLVGWRHVRQARK